MKRQRPNEKREETNIMPAKDKSAADSRSVPLEDLQELYKIYMGISGVFELVDNLGSPDPEEHLDCWFIARALEAWMDRFHDLCEFIDFPDADEVRHDRHPR